MAETWTAITNGQVDVDSPIDTALMTALRDNPEGIAAGVNDAPYGNGAWKPYDSAVRADGLDGELWSFATDGDVATIETPTFEEGKEYLVTMENIDITSGTPVVRQQLYFDTAASWSPASPDTISGTVPTNGKAFIWVHIPAPVITRNMFWVNVYTMNIQSTGLLSASSGTHATRTTFCYQPGSAPANTDRVTQWRINEASGQIFNGGVVRLFERGVWEY